MHLSFTPDFRLVQHHKHNDYFRNESQGLGIGLGSGLQTGICIVLELIKKM